MRKRQLWAIVLAGGEGSRLSPLTTDEQGVHVPKQYCSFGASPSLLRQSIERAEAVIDPQRIVVVVNEAHRRWWEPELRHLDGGNLIVQPGDRGTGVGLLLALMHVRHQDPEGTLLVLPSHHVVENEQTLRWSLVQAVRTAGESGRVCLLGIEPEGPESWHNWIRPLGGGRDAAILSLVDRPNGDEVVRLVRRGALVDTGVIAAPVSALLAAFERSMPSVVKQVALAFTLGSSHWRKRIMPWLFNRLPVADFARDVAPVALRSLRVVRAPACGCIELTTPHMVERHVARRVEAMPSRPAMQPPLPDAYAPIDLARTVAGPLPYRRPPLPTAHTG